VDARAGGEGVGAAVQTILDGIEWLTTADNWGGRNGIGRRVLQHLWYSFVATLAAVVIALPIGLAIGHTGKGRFLAANLAGLWRAIPTIGVVMLIFRWKPLSVWPVIAALVVLAIPPIVLNTVAGLDSVTADVKDAARGMGLTGRQALWQVEIPNGLPLILAGVRSAANQVIATATVAGLVGLGSLGYYIFLAGRTQNYAVMAGASIAIIILVLTVEAAFALLQRVLVSPGVRQRSPRRLRAAGSLPPVQPVTEAVP
jgi:osmoprotectant transport system permease protein